jgi:disulfide bond formation protein DsbB
MLDNFPLSRVLKTLITGTGECAVVDWTFLGLSIAEWSLGCFAALFVYALWLALRRPKAAAAAEMTFPEVEGKFR